MRSKKADQFLTSQEVQEFVELVKETKGIELTKEEALDQGTRLIMLFEKLSEFEPIQLLDKDVVEKSQEDGKK